MTPRIKVLFLCMGNSARSQMAEAFLRSMAPDTYDAYSAGLEPREIHPLTRQVMAEVGHDLAGQRSKSVREYLGKQHFDYIITVCDQADEKCPTTFPGVGDRLHWSFEDPAAFTGTPEAQLAKFREVRDLIRHQVHDWLLESHP
jgi:arsenate reductase